MKKLVSTLIIAAIASIAFTASAAPDESQRMMTQRVQEAKQKLAAAQAAKGTERQKMMQEHMSMMQKTMGQMQAMKPRDGMTPQEQKEWMAEHQKLMDMMMGQMMDEHHLMMQTNCK